MSLFSFISQSIQHWNAISVVHCVSLCFVVSLLSLCCFYSGNSVEILLKAYSFHNELQTFLNTTLTFSKLPLQ